MDQAVDNQLVSLRRSQRRAILWIALLSFGAVALGLFAVPAAKSAYIYYHRRGEFVEWQNMEFRLPAPWFRRTYRADSRAILVRDQLPWSVPRGIPIGQRTGLAMISLLPADSDFAQAPGLVLARWECQVRQLASSPNLPLDNPVSNHNELSFTNTRNAKEEFRCANLVINGPNGKTYIDMDCVSVRNGWRFDYEGLRDYSTEALSILNQAR
jgi:hypothetical protein